MCWKALFLILESWDKNVATAFTNPQVVLKMYNVVFLVVPPAVPIPPGIRRAFFNMGLSRDLSLA